MTHLSWLSCALLAGCAVGGTVPEAARFDFGPVAPPSLAGVASVTVSEPSWLEGSMMQYRLAYAEPTRRRSYTGSRWVASPGELLRQTLARGAAGGLCRLGIQLDELLQVFDGPDRSHVELQLRATLTAASGPVASRAFARSVPAARADAEGGVAAAAAAVAGVGDDLGQWLKNEEQAGVCRQ